MFKAIIEIPKGCDRRIHLKKDENKFFDFGPIKEKIPINKGIMPENYGFIKGTFNEADNDEIDAVVFSDNDLKTGEEIEIIPIAILKRKDEDDKIVAIDEAFTSFNKWNDVNKEIRELLISFMGYKSEIISIEDSASAIEYIKDNLRNEEKN